MPPDHPEHQYVLFVRPRAPEQEVWTGKRAGVEGAKERFGADEAYPIEEFDEKISEYIGTSGQLYYGFGADDALIRRLSNSSRGIDDIAYVRERDPPP